MYCGVEQCNTMQCSEILLLQECWVGSTRELLTLDPEKGQGAVGGCSGHHIMRECWSWSLTKLAATHYAPLITKSPVKVCINQLYTYIHTCTHMYRRLLFHVLMWMEIIN